MGSRWGKNMPEAAKCTANLRTKIQDLGGFDSSRILIARGGVPRPNRGFPGKLESSNLSGGNLSILVGTLGVEPRAPAISFSCILCYITLHYINHRFTIMLRQAEMPTRNALFRAGALAHMHNNHDTTTTNHNDHTHNVILLLLIMIIHIT